MTSNHSSLEDYCDNVAEWFKPGMPASSLVGSNPEIRKGLQESSDEQRPVFHAA